MIEFGYFGFVKLLDPSTRCFALRCRCWGNCHGVSDRKAIHPERIIFDSGHIPKSKSAKVLNVSNVDEVSRLCHVTCIKTQNMTTTPYNRPHGSVKSFRSCLLHLRQLPSERRRADWRSDCDATSSFRSWHLLHLNLQHLFLNDQPSQGHDLTWGVPGWRAEGQLLQPARSPAPGPWMSMIKSSSKSVQVSGVLRCYCNNIMMTAHQTQCSDHWSVLGNGYFKGFLALLASSLDQMCSPKQRFNLVFAMAFLSCLIAQKLLSLLSFQSVLVQKGLMDSCSELLVRSWLLTLQSLPLCRTLRALSLRCCTAAWGSITSKGQHPRMQPIVIPMNWPA